MIWWAHVEHLFKVNYNDNKIRLCSWVFPAGIYLFKVNNGNSRKMCEANFVTHVRWTKWQGFAFFLTTNSLLHFVRLWQALFWIKIFRRSMRLRCWCKHRDLFLENLLFSMFRKTLAINLWFRSVFFGCYRYFFLGNS